jgi:transposase InsO family protein
VNHKRVERLMAANGICGRSGRKKVRTTVRDPNAALSADLVNRRFEQTVLDTLWVGDATYIPTDEGWLYLATVIDACSRRLLGWSMTDHLRTELCLDALDAAVDTRGGKANIDGVIFHTDHGCQLGFNGSSQHRLCYAERRSSSRVSAGVFHPSVLRGRVLSASATASISSRE